jgi:multisubunit Na+/H+ antiporter MnhB subunit
LKKSALLATLFAGALLLYGTRDFAPWGDPNAPASRHISPTYIEKSLEQTHVPNIVTAVLADYRGYDTMFETIVIFCAGVVVVSVLRRPGA